MQHGRPIIAIALIAALSAVSCASARSYARATEQLKRGDLSGAVLSAAAALQHSSRNYDALALLESTLPDAVAQQRAQSDAALEGKDPLRWETVVRCWQTIHAMSDAVRALPPLYEKKSKTPVAFSLTYDRDLLARAKGEAAAYRYSEGERLMSAGRRASYREAYDDFGAALAYVPGYSDAEKRAAEARELGSDHIAVVPFSSELRVYGADRLLGQLYGGCVSALVEAAAAKKFVEVVERSRMEAILSEHELSSSGLADIRVGPEAIGIYGANILVFGQLLDYAAVAPDLKVSTESFVADVDEPIPGAAPVNGAVPTMKVKERAYTTRFTLRSAVSATAAYRAVDLETSVILQAKTISDQMEDVKEWVEWQGDKEALPPSYASLADNRDRSVSRPEEMEPALALRMDRAFASTFVGGL